ncbi:MAG: hypothetical protein AAGC68_01995 [Verrucomicrobiota bacterium]
MLTTRPGLFLISVLLLFVGTVDRSRGEADPEAITRIVDRFNAIENNIASMQHLTMDVTHTDSDYGLGVIEVWIEGDMVAKIRNESNRDGSRNIQEMWMEQNEVVFAYERSEWHGNQDGSVNINEYRTYVSAGQVIREMSRSDTRAAGQSLDLSNVSHQTSDIDDPEYGRSLFHDKRTQAGAIIKSAYAFSGPNGVPDLLSWPYRVMLQTISPDGRSAFAWGIRGVTNPDWLAWEEKSYEYLDTLGDAPYELHLVNLADGYSIGTIEAEFEPGGRPYFWTKWAEDSSIVVVGSDFRWSTASAAAYGIGNGGVVLAAELSERLSKLAFEVLEQNDHPYVIGNESAIGFIDVRSLSSGGEILIDYAVESKFEGQRRNAYLELQTQIDFNAGELNIISASLPDYDPVPTTWDKFAAMLSEKASGWLAAPPILEDFLQLQTFHEDGVFYLFNQFGAAIDPEIVEILTRRELFLSGPHYPGGIVTESRFEFGYYDPLTVQQVAHGFGSVLNPGLVGATQGLYDAKFRSLAHHFQEALHYWEQNPAELEHQKEVYLRHLQNETLPEFFYTLDGNLGERLMESYSADFTEQSCYLTALRFWMRRSIDGSYTGFADLLQKVISAYEPQYFSSRGLPDLLIESWDEERGEGMIEVVMEESGAMGVNHLTSFELNALREALPGLTVAPVEFYDQGGQHPAFAVELGEAEVLRLIRFDSGDPLAFEMRSNNIQLWNGISTGDRFGDVFRERLPLGFFNGLETDVGAVMVEAPGSERITLLFTPPDDYSGDFLESTRSEMADFVLYEMRWTP